MKIPEGYKPQTLKQMLAHFANKGSTALGKMLFAHAGDELWATVKGDPDTGKTVRSEDLITVLEERGLLQFAIDPDDDPAMFVAPREAFGSDGEGVYAFAQKLVSFWDVTGDYNVKTGAMLTQPMVKVKTPEGELACVESVAKRLVAKGIIIRTIDGAYHGPSQKAVVDGMTKLGICDFCSDSNPKYKEDVPDFVLETGYNSIDGWATCETCHQLVVERRKKDLLQRSMMLASSKLSGEALISLHKKFWDALESVSRPKLPPSTDPHWQQALNWKGDAIKALKIIDKADKRAENPSLYADLLDDLQALKLSEVYSFNGETMHAIIAGSQSIPHESPLSSVTIPPVRAGWFWFGEPFPAASSPIASDYTHALLWTWDTRMKTPCLRFSSYVIDEKRAFDSELIVPSTKWYWPVEMSFHQMIGMSHQLYDNEYGPGSKWAPGKDKAIGKDATLKVIGELSLFFLMSCVWFKQQVIVSTPGHIERHARKRYQADHKLKEPPTVRVIALRKAIRDEATGEAPEGVSGRHLTVRFVVSGHPRLQPYGPGRTEKRLIWIDPYPKGPENAPFKPSATKVYAVVR